MLPRISINAPVVLTLSLICTVLLMIDDNTSNATKPYCTVHGTFHYDDPVDYLRLFSHSVGHANWTHLISNLSLILLIGPILEERYGSGVLLLMILATSLITGILNVLLFDTSLYGASGIVFMMILLSSFVNYRSGTIPLTFVLIVALYLGKEIGAAFTDDGISHFAHVLGGGVGSLFGFFAGGSKVEQPVEEGAAAMVAVGGTAQAKEHGEAKEQEQPKRTGDPSQENTPGDA